MVIVITRAGAAASIGDLRAKKPIWCSSMRESLPMIIGYAVAELSIIM